MNEKYDCVAIVHRIFTEGKRKRGGADIIIDYISKTKKVLLIEHPLSALKETTGQSFYGAIISEVSNGDIKEIRRIKVVKLPVPLNWILEVVVNIQIINWLAKGEQLKEKKPVLVSADPLNALVGALVPFKFSKRYFHLIDFSEKRFENPILNKFYKVILTISLRNSDIVGTVSQRILEKINAKYGKFCPIIHIPNSPEFKRVPLNKKEPFSIVYSGGAIISKYDYEKVVDILALVKKEFPKVKLYAVGGVEQDKEYVCHIQDKAKRLKVLGNIIFTGFLTLEEVEKIYLKSEIGLSFYSSDVSYYTYYGDSLKIREYSLYGIPTICDGNSATDEEVEKVGAGFIAKDTPEAVKIITGLFANKKRYNEVQGKCVAWAKRMDKGKILENLYARLFNS